MNLTAHHLRINLSVETPIELDKHPGKSLRGMLFHALRGPLRNPALGFCTQRHLQTCADCALVAACPVASLVATLNPEAERGRDVPRPFALVPPAPGKNRFEPGETLTFGLTLFGDALNLFPYVVMALHQAGPYGVGKHIPQETAGGKPRRGRFHLHAVYAVNLITGEMQDVLPPGSSLVRQPSLPVTQRQIEAAALAMLGQRLAHSANGHQGDPLQRGAAPGPVEITIDFLTPTRIVHQKHLQKIPRFSPLFHRLLDRLMILSQQFSPVTERMANEQTVNGGQLSTNGKESKPENISTGEYARQLKRRLLPLADTVEMVDHQTRWVDVWSYSARQNRKTPIGGVMGQATYRADRAVWDILLPYLLWGMVIHVGKNAVKGDGIMVVSREQGAGSG